MDWLPYVVCGLIYAGLLWRWRMLGGRRLPVRFWAGLALQASIWLGAHYTIAEAWLAASWGLWLTLDGLAASCGRPAIFGEQSDSAVWALVISLFGWTGVEYLNLYFPVWTLLGFSFNPLIRQGVLGLLGAPIIPTALAVAALLGSGSDGIERHAGALWWRVAGAAMIGGGWSGWIGPAPALLLVVVGAVAVCSPGFFSQGMGRLLALAAGVATWAAFDTLWSQIGPAERLSVDYSSPALLPAVLTVCAFALVGVYDAAVEFLDKPRFDPFSRSD